MVYAITTSYTNVILKNPTHIIGFKLPISQSLRLLNDKQLDLQALSTKEGFKS